MIEIRGQDQQNRFFDSKEEDAASIFNSGSDCTDGLNFNGRPIKWVSE